jgi:hypothetical protein
MGLMRGVARTAVIAGTATAVSNRVSRRQANRWADQEQQAYEEQPQAQYAPAPAPAPAAAPAPDRYDQLAKLAELKDQGVLTTAEFEVEKAKLLGL